MQYVAEHDLGDGGNRRVLEIQVEAVAARDLLRPLVGDRRDFGALVDLRGAVAIAAGSGGRRATGCD